MLLVLVSAALAVAPHATVGLALPPLPPVSYPPSGKVRIKVVDTGRYLYENTITLAPVSKTRERAADATQILVSDRLLSTRGAPSVTNTKSHFTFTLQTDGSYKITTVGTNYEWHTDGGVLGDDLVSTRTQPNDDFTRYYIEEYCDGSVRFKVKGNNKYLHSHENGDKLLSTRYTAPASDKKTRFILEYVSLAEYIPSNWASQEIEAKWSISMGTYNALLSAFTGSYSSPTNTYALNVRWNGISRKYVDQYYDNAVVNGDLAASGHSFRVRTRATSDPLAGDNSHSTLQAANWDFDWQKVQYKSTAVRIDALWLREEVGNCRVLGGSPAETCAVTDLNAILGGDIGHPANVLLQSDHPSFSYVNFQEVTQVVDYRYRVEFLLGGVEVFELSLDRVETKHASDGFTSTSYTYEAELEIIKPGYTLADIEELMAIVRQMEDNFNLPHSKVSKGGIYVDNVLIPGNSGSCLAVPPSILVEIKFPAFP